MSVRTIGPYLRIIALLGIAAGAFLLLLTPQDRYRLERLEQIEEEERGYADDAFEWWYAQRALPGGTIPAGALFRAYDYTRRSMESSLAKTTGADTSVWQSIGPNNVGGRVLSVAIDPDNPQVLWAGSASGGIWKSATGGAGAAAWQYVQTGFPLLSVSAIAIDPLNSNVMYIGTGEISGYNLGQVGTPGARSTYGLGILKSTDRGTSWSPTGLTWTFDQMRSVQRIAVNPLNSGVLYAATSEGTYRSNDTGATWNRVLDTLMAMDVALNPVDTGTVFVACGQRNTSPNAGLFRSTDGGAHWTKLGSTLPTSNFGRTCLAIAPSNPQVVYASIANAVTHGVIDLFRTTDGGDTWTPAYLRDMTNTFTNYLGGQGWYDNVIAVDPQHPNLLFAAGIDIYRSTSWGDTISQQSYWWKDYGGVVPAGGPEGSSDYVHADHHAIAFDPTNPLRIIFGTDGGVFESDDGGLTFAGRNGGFMTSQFYNGFANAASDSLVALGGTQDNGTLKFQGTISWNKVYGGDGGWCAIDPANPLHMLEEYVYLTIALSTDGGASWTQVLSSTADSSNFIAPLAIAPSTPSVVYAGAKHVFKSTDGGSSWSRTNGGLVLNGSNISCIDVSWSSADTVIAATGQRTAPVFEVFRTVDGGAVWSKSLSALPNRYPTDIAFDSRNSATAYLTYSGYGSPHVYKSGDAGLTWTDISANLPDLPVQSITVDPLSSLFLYIGTDLGVYQSGDGGTSWQPYMTGMPPAMVLDVGFSRRDHRLRAATFGNGAYQRKVPDPATLGVPLALDSRPSQYSLSQNYPNPFNPATEIRFSLPTRGQVRLSVYDVAGREVALLYDGPAGPGTHTVRWDAGDKASGIYFCRYSAGPFTGTRKMLLIK